MEQRRKQGGERKELIKDIKKRADRKKKRKKGRTNHDEWGDKGLARYLWRFGEVTIERLWKNKEVL